MFYSISSHKSWCDCDRGPIRLRGKIQQGSAGGQKKKNVKQSNPDFTMQERTEMPCTMGLCGLYLLTSRWFHWISALSQLLRHAGSGAPAALSASQLSGAHLLLSGSSFPGTGYTPNYTKTVKPWKDFVVVDLPYLRAAYFLTMANSTWKTVMNSKFF